MGTILPIVLVVLLLGGGGGYWYSRRQEIVSCVGHWRNGCVALANKWGTRLRSVRIHLAALSTRGIGHLVARRLRS